MATANLEPRPLRGRPRRARASTGILQSASSRHEREREISHACALGEAREELWSLLLELPEAVRSHVFRDTATAGRRRRFPSHERIEIAFDRLVGYEAGRDDELLAELVVRATRLERRIERAREQLVLDNLHLVPQVARQFRTGPIPLSDLVQEGYVGLLQAVDRFDPTRGYRFATYAVWWIRRGVLEAFSQRSRLIRLPDSLREDLRRMRRTEEELELGLGRRPLPPEIASRMKVSLRKMSKLMNVVPEPTAIEDLANGENALSQRPRVPDPLERALALELQGQAHQALRLLDARELAVIRLRFGFDGEILTLAEIGVRIGLSRERVRQIEGVALDKIHTWAVRRGLRSARAV